MGAKTTVNKRTVVHAESSGSVKSFPDVCKTPAGPSVVPIPYPNTALSKDASNGSVTVKVDGCPVMLKGSVFATSTGDEPGTAGGGVVSSVIKGKAEFLTYSFDVTVEGRNMCRLGDMMGLNQAAPGAPSNTPPAVEVQPNLISMPGLHQNTPDEDFEIVQIEVV